MDAYEATRVVFSRIQTLDPENASKIMGLLLIQDHGEKEMIRLALGPESLLQTLILKARKELSLAVPPSSSLNSSPRLLPSPTSWASSQPFSRANNGGLDEVPSSEELYGELIDDFSPFQDQNSVLYQDENLAFQNSLGMGGAGLGFGWKPCLYFARGYCKNGASCRFLHDDKLDAATAASLALEQEFLLRSKSPRSQLMASSFPYSPTGSNKNLGFLLQQQNEAQRVYDLMARSPRLDRCDLMAGLNNPGARQIYLTFPADSTFSEEDVSNYFSIYGPVQDVRIPYQQKRMFGFVTFVYPETVKLILAKGNPHFVCDARVLVKPYKEKGKVPEKYRNKNLERLDFSGCTTPTGLLDSRDPFELPHLGTRMLYGTSPTQEAFLRRKLEEQVELQQAIELQGRRFMGLQLMDFKNRGSVINNSLSVTNNLSPVTSESNNGSDGSNSTNSDQPTNQGNVVTLTDKVGPEKVNGSNEVNADKRTEAKPNVDCDFQERGLEHNLPDSPFASQIAESPFLPNGPSSLNNSNNVPFMPSPIIPPNSIDIASYNSCFFQMPRFSSGHGAIGM